MELDVLDCPVAITPKISTLESRNLKPSPEFSVNRSLSKQALFPSIQEKETSGSRKNKDDSLRKSKNMKDRTILGDSFDMVAE